MHLVLQPFFDPDFSAFSYLVVNPATRTCAVIDPVLGFDAAARTFNTRSADRLIEAVQANGYVVEWILETQVHTDHLSAAQYLKQHFVCAQTAVSGRVVEIQRHFSIAFGMQVPVDGSQFDRLLADNDKICLGHTCARVLTTPGSTPAGISFVFDDFAFVGDVLSMPDCGTARCDLPLGDAAALYRSVQRLYELPPAMRLLVCHDQALAGREHRFLTSVAEQRQSNLHLHQQVTEAEFVAARRMLDDRLDPPRQMELAVRFNMVGGRCEELRGQDGRFCYDASVSTRAA